MTTTPEARRRTSPRERRLRRGLLLFVVSLLFLLGLGGVIQISQDTPPWWTPLGASALGIFTASWVFVLSIGVLRRLLRFEWRVLAVARVVLEEALRRRVAIAGATLLLVVVVSLPFTLEESRLDYRLQSFLSYSLGLATLILSVMTIFISCASIADEVEDGRIEGALVKPIRRSTYVLGKLLGIALLNAVLLLVTGAAVYAFTQLQLTLAAGSESRAPASGDSFAAAGVNTIDATELRRVYRDVLSARTSVQPRAIDAELERRARELWDSLSPEQRRSSGGNQAALDFAREQVRRQWRYLEPGHQEVYLFDGLQGGIFYPGECFVRLKPLIPFFHQEAEARLLIRWNGGPAQEIFVKTKEEKLLPVDLAILETGALALSIENPAPRDGPAVLLQTADGLQVLYPVGRFGGNLVRGCLVLWCKLIFLAALGVFASTFLGFPVACLMVLILGLCAAASGYVLDVEVEPHGHSHGGAASHGHPHDHSEEGGASAAPQTTARSEPTDPLFIRAMDTIGRGVATVLQAYSRYPVVTRLVDGRAITWREVGGVWLEIGVLWSGVVTLLGAWIFTRRELAKVQI